MNRPTANERCPAAPLTAIACAVALLTGLPQPVRAADECGADTPGANTVVCAPGTYGSGIAYTPSDGVTLVLDDPGIVVQGNSPAVYVFGAPGNTNGLTVRVTSGSIANNSPLGSGSAITIQNPGDGPANVFIDGGTLTGNVAATSASGSGNVAIAVNGGQITSPAGSFGSGLVSASTTGTSTGTASVVVTGGTMRVDSGTVGGVTAFNSNANSASSPSVSMTGGTVDAGFYGLRSTTSGLGDALVSMTGGAVRTRSAGSGLQASISNTASAGSARIHMGGGSVRSEGNGAAISAETNGTGKAIVQMSAGTATATVHDGVFVRASGAAGSYAVDITGGTVTAGSGAQSAGVRTSGGAGGTLNIGAAAIIHAGASGIAIRDGDGDRNGTEDTASNATITTAGTINGAIVLGNGSDSLTVSGGSINGNISGDGPDTLRFALGSGSFTYGAPYAITGLDSVALDSGAVQIDGAVTSNTLAVNGGSLRLTGTGNFAGGAAVNGGSLSGSGSITGNLAVNSGTLASGNGTGALTASGDLSFEPGATYLVQFNAAGAPSAVSAVNAGTLTINGGQVRVGAGGGAFTRNTPYTILTASGARTGTFEGVSTDLALLTPTLAYEPNAVVLTMVPIPGAYEAIGQTPNEQAVGGHLGSFADNPGEAAALIQQIEGLSTPEARRAFASLAGSQHASASQVASAAGRHFSSILSARTGFSASGLQQAGAPAQPQYASLNPAHLGVFAQLSDAGPGAVAPRTRDLDEAALAARPSGGLWLQPIHAAGDIGNDVNSPSLDYRANGFAIGYDRPLDERWLVGAAFGYQRSEWDANIRSLSDSPASGKLHSAQAGLYASYKGRAWRLRADLTLGLNDFDTERTVNIGGGSALASSSHRGHELGASVQAEYPIAWGAWQLRPLLGARYSHQRESGFDESGPSVGNLSVGSRSAQSLTASAGARFVRPLQEGRGALELRVVASHLFGDEENAVRARVLGQAGGFKASGSPLKRDALTLGASVTGQWTRTLWGFADAAYEYRGSGQDAYQLTIGLRKFF